MAAILEHQPTWMTLFRARGVDPAAWKAESALTGVLCHVHGSVSEVAAAIVAGTITLRVMHQTSKAREQGALLELLEFVRVRILPAQLFRSQLAILAIFDQTLAEVSCFVNSFCHCGVPIDRQALHDKLQSLTARYDTLTLNEVRDCFAAELQLYGTQLRWLFALRDSALFLSFWRRIGHALSQEQVAAEQHADAAAGAAAAADEDHLWSFMDLPLARGIDVEEKKDVEQADQQKRVLSQQRVVESLLPTVKREWRHLLHTVRDRSIPVSVLHRTFGLLSTDAECLSELLTLVRTGEGELISTAISVKDDVAYRWIEECAQQLHDFLLMERMAKWLPALLRIRELLQLLFTTDVAADAHYQRLNQLLSSQQQSWSQQTLGSLSALVTPVKAEVGGFNMQQLNFLVLFSKCEGLIRWLLEHKDTADFNKLLQVCRPSTDEPRILSSMASLTTIRTMLLQFLYTKPPYPSLRELLQFFRESVDLEGEVGCNHLANIQSSFESLMDVFEKQTRSPGIKAFYDVREISEQGEFVVRAGLALDRTLRLEFCPSAAPIDVVSSSSSSSSSSAAPALPAGRSETLEYLLDLRSKLLMTEIPPEIEEEFGMSRLVDSFVTQLQLVVEIRDHVVHLHQLGHFDYQEFSIRFPFNVDMLLRLHEERRKLLEETERWTALVSRMRSQFYFLNYFTMHEILRVADILRRASSGQSSSSSSSGRAKLRIKPAVKEVPAAAAAPTHASKKEAAPKKEEPKVVIPTIYACEACTFENPVHRETCEICGSERPAQITILLASRKESSKSSSSSSSSSSSRAVSAASAASAGPSGPQVLSASAQQATQILFQDASQLETSGDVLDELCSYLHLISSHVDSLIVVKALAERLAMLTLPESQKLQVCSSSYSSRLFLDWLSSTWLL